MRSPILSCTFAAVPLPMMHPVRSAMKALCSSGESLISGMICEQAVGFDGEAGEHILRLFVDSAEPLVDHYVLYAGDPGDFVAIGDRHYVGERDAIASYEPARLFGRWRREEKRVIDRHEDAEKAQGSSDAADRQYGSATVAHRVFRDQRQVTCSIVSLEKSSLAPRFARNRIKVVIVGNDDWSSF